MTLEEVKHRAARINWERHAITIGVALLLLWVNEMRADMAALGLSDRDHDREIAQIHGQMQVTREWQRSVERQIYDLNKDVDERTKNRFDSDRGTRLEARVDVLEKRLFDRSKRGE